ncbi:hypothetical protein SAMN05192558_102171 [Actinokineospora alba]|uniref:Uncharacterized protein n=1 Tax=Actinokineospora alba TaxID=504798 RepID=A0A1H0HLY5_9PSEU|nr:hypothetical protein C8E96_0307 [Actinokineospora alba]SDH47095.1 hypothetical protein SAMN05421871_101132 [Actinokineospora alba]SDO20172.1 hypothetical protein SAMN05192558_102171 [Actinokineospora alba]
MFLEKRSPVWPDRWPARFLTSVKDGMMMFLEKRSPIWLD